MAKNYIDNLSEEVKKGHLEKARQGEYPAKAPFGYVNDTKTGLVEVDPTKAKFVVRMFELAATGQYSFKAIRTAIMQEGLEFYSPKVRLSKSHQSTSETHHPRSHRNSSVGSLDHSSHISYC